MKICHILFSLKSGGTENIVVDIINEQSNIHSLSLIIIDDIIDTSLQSRISDSVNVIYISRKKSYILQLFAIFKLWVILFFINPKVIHCHNIKCGQIIPFWKKISYLTLHSNRIPFISSSGELIFKSPDRKSLIRYKKIFVVSETVGKTIQKFSNLESVLIYNGVKLENFKPILSIRMDYKQIRLVQIGRLVHSVKGQHLLIQAVDLIRKRHSDMNIILDFIGDGPSINYLKVLVEKSGLQDIINFKLLKSRKWIECHLNDYDILIQPSIFEGFGLTVVEALGIGMPALVSKIDGPLEIIKDNPLGFQFEKGNVADLADKIVLIINNLRLGNIDSIRSYGRDLCVQRFSIRTTVENYLSNY